MSEEKYNVVLSIKVRRVLEKVHLENPMLYGELIVLLQSLEKGPRYNDAFVKKLRTSKGEGDLYYGIAETGVGPWQLAYLKVDGKREIVVPLLGPIIH